MGSVAAVRRPARRLAVAVLVLLVGIGCTDDQADRSSERSGPPDQDPPSETVEPEEPGDGTEAGPPGAVEVAADDLDALYEVPDPLPDGAHGDLVRYQEVEPSPEGARSYRVMYLSESLEGEPIVVTGTVVVPDAPAPPAGRTVLTIAHGTTGIADECAPSRAGGAAELVIAGPAVERGWIMAVTDYEGLGTPGRHPYLVGESEGRSVIDAVLAAGQLPDAERSDTVAIAGYSQGGHGALWAAEVAAGWAPELDVVGTFAGAPATELDLILSAAGAPGVAGFGVMMVAGFEAAYPEADPALFLTDEGTSLLDAVDEGCTGDVFAALAGASGPLVRPDGPRTPPWPELARENNPGQVVLEDPVLIIHSDEDDVVPVALSGILFDRMCGLGQSVERRVLEGGGDHGAAARVAYPQAVDWFDRILAGEPVPSTCP